MKTKNFILFLLIILLIIPFSSCNKNCEHEFVNKSFLTQPTCETQGEVLMKCKKCKLEETKVLNALGHDYVYETIVEPSCHNTGLKKGVCRRDPSHKDEVILDKLPHNFINYIDDNNASFKQNGTKTAKCENEGCNAIDVVEYTHEQWSKALSYLFEEDIQISSAAGLQSFVAAKQAEVQDEIGK